MRFLSHSDLTSLIVSMGNPAYRAQQVYQWLHSHHVLSYDEMKNVPKALREALSERCPLNPPALADQQVAEDGTGKFLWDYGDVWAETVAIPSEERLTVCFSSQAGCPMGCLFCATGHQGFQRNLTAEEIIDQIIGVLRAAPEVGLSPRISNAVAMGQGEPFLNYDALLRALRELNNPESFAIGARKITVSTCGIIAGIERFATEPEQFGLAVSLHAAVQSTRDYLMPGVSNQPLTALREALERYTAATGRRVTLEYALIEGVNDSREDFQALVDFCRDQLVHVNLIPLNPIGDDLLKPASSAELTAWNDELQRQGVPSSVRHSRGASIAGACGQLANARH